MRVEEMFDSVSQQLAQMVAHVQEVRQSNIRIERKIGELQDQVADLTGRTTGAAGCWP